jgi:RNA polymerase sigma-70 factor (ECF subfamily)
MSKQATEIDEAMQALVAAAKAGDYAAFERLVELNESAIYTLAMRMLQRREDAEEVVQDTFLSVLEHLADFRGDSAFRTWLVRIATNHALKVLRRRRVHRTVPLDQGDDDHEPLPHPDFIAQWRDDPAELVEQRETQHLLNQAIGNLDEKYRMIFLLRDVEGLTTEEAASTLGISVANAKVRLLRARLMLRERLTREFGDPAARVAPHKHE